MIEYPFRKPHWLSLSSNISSEKSVILLHKMAVNNFQNSSKVQVIYMGAWHLSGFVTYKVLHLSGNFMLKRAEFTCVLPFAWTIHNDRLFQQKQQTTFPYYHLLEKLNIADDYIGKRALYLGQAENQFIHSTIFSFTYFCFSFH